MISFIMDYSVDLFLHDWIDCLVCKKFCKFVRIAVTITQSQKWHIDNASNY